MQIAVTYVRVSSLICIFASLPCGLFQRLAKRRLCQRFGTDRLNERRSVLYWKIGERINGLTHAVFIVENPEMIPGVLLFMKKRI
jgi:hypothetical protein